MALTGEALLISSRGGGAGEAGLSGELIVLSSNVFASLGYVAGGRLQQAGYPSPATTFWGVVLASAMLLPITPFLLADLAVEAVGLPVWLAVAYLAVGVTILGYIA